MNYYFAPMEGITGYVYRNAHHQFFPGIDKYFTPFLAPNQHKSFNSGELRDILPEHNEGVFVVPQILTNRAEDFIRASVELKQMGYEEVNLNLGCPSGTVVAKNRGSGFLAQPEKLEQFLEEVFSKLDMKISIKTRLGRDDPEEFYELLELFNQYPLEELIIHPRIQKDYYKNQPRLDVFKEGLALSRNPVCYNGDIFTVHRYEAFTSSFPEVETVMLGRGLIANPGLVMEIRNDGAPDKQRLREFHDEICSGYQDYLSGDRNVLFRMKELWFYMAGIFTNHEKYAKRIRKSDSLADYNASVASLFREQELIKGAGFQSSPF